MIVATAYRIDDSTYPNSRALGSDGRRNAYWRCIASMALSARIFGKSQDRIIVFTNDRPPEEFADAVKACGIELIDIPFTYEPPAGLYDKFVGALYLLDAIEWAAANIGSEDSIVFVDPDCIFTKEISRLQDGLERAQLILYEVDYPLKHIANGHSRESLAAVSSSFPGENGIRRIPRWIGGEFIAARKQGLFSLSSAAKSIWEANLGRLGLSGRLNTEEHIISMACHRFDIRYDTANEEYVTRIWTAARYRRYSATAVDYLVWHLPAEKERGFAKVYEMLYALKRREGGPSVDDIRMVARRMSVLGPSLREAVFIVRQTALRTANIVRGKANEF